jgi:predicted nucleic acid-binding protein
LIGLQPNWLLGRSLRAPVVALTLQHQLGKGESEAIGLILGLELENISTILLDDSSDW